MHSGNYEVRDYKGRTPLHLAAELDRTVVAEYLLSLDQPAKCTVYDDQGNHVITTMIRTMPQVVSLPAYEHIMLMSYLIIDGYYGDRLTLKSDILCEVQVKISVSCMWY